MQIGDHLVVSQIGIEKNTTKAPAPYTDSTLIDAMTNIHRLVKDEELKKVFKRVKGIGTQRTQTDSIEKNISDGYCQRQGRFIRTTDKARDVLSKLDKRITDPVLTAQWEVRLRSIELGEIDADIFFQSLRSNLQQVVDAGINTKIESDHLRTVVPPTPGSANLVEPLPGHGKACPRCKSGQLLTRTKKGTSDRFLGCSNFSKKICNYSESVSA